MWVAGERNGAVLGRVGGEEGSERLVSFGSECSERVYAPSAWVCTVLQPYVAVYGSTQVLMGLPALGAIRICMVLATRVALV